MLTTSASYNVITKNLTRTLDAAAKQPMVARETEYYLANIGKVTSIDDFLDDKRLFTYAMKAFGLEDMSYAKALIRKVLKEGIDDKSSFANTLADQRYTDFATAFNFQRYGTATTAFDRTQQGTVDRYVRQVVEEDAGKDNDGVRLALYFQRKASSVTSAYGILADPAILKVAQTVLGLPASLSNLDIDKQADIIKSKFDITDLQDPAKVDKLLQKFTSLWEIANPSQPAAVPSIIIGQGSTGAIGMDLLTSLQNLRLGGS
ncbi:MAG: DUF1217 domain-containing protein [Hyphomicrobiaceae bacterium]